MVTLNHSWKWTYVTVELVKRTVIWVYIHTCIKWRRTHKVGEMATWFPLRAECMDVPFYRVYEKGVTNPMRIDSPNEQCQDDAITIGFVPDIPGGKANHYISLLKITESLGNPFFRCCFNKGRFYWENHVNHCKNGTPFEKEYPTSWDFNLPITTRFFAKPSSALHFEPPTFYPWNASGVAFYLVGSGGHHPSFGGLGPSPRETGLHFMAILNVL